MIKVNLANSLLKKSEGAKSSMSITEGTMLRDSAIKIALMIAPVIGIMYYEKMDLETKNQNLQRLTLQRDQLNQEIQSKQSVDEIVKNVKEQQADMDDKLKVMEKIFGLRSKKIQALSMLQKHIPQALWLQKVSVSEQSTTEGIGKTTVAISGFSLNLADIQVYITLLEQEREIFESIKGQNISAEDIAKPDAKQDVNRFSFDIVLKD